MNASVKLLESLLPASVTVRADVPAGHPSARILGTERVGSGTLVQGDGVVLTVSYVVLGARELRVTLLDGTEFKGEVVAQDFFSGLAVLRVPHRGSPGVTPRSSATLRLGQDVFLLTSAGDRNRRVNSGVVSSLDAFDAYWEYRLERGIRTTAMNPGLGGGGLFTSRGELVGVVALDLAEIGRFTLAIPVENFLDYRDELLQHGRRVSRPPRAWVGFYCYEVADHVVVGGVLPGTPAEQWGLQAGDIVLRVAGTAVRGRGELYERLWAFKPGEVVPFEVVRERAVQEVSVLAVDADEFFA